MPSHKLENSKHSADERALSIICTAHCFSCSSDKFSGAYVIIKEYKELFTPGGDEIESVVKDPESKNS